MGYSTNFNGSLQFDSKKPVSDKIKNFINKFSDTRRMGRNIEGYGVEGEFFVDGEGFKGQRVDDIVIDNNQPPKTQPGLWCQWIIDENNELAWDGGEKFYHYTEWLFYIVEKILKPNGYSVSGKIEWDGEDFDDNGVIEVDDNKIYVNSQLLEPNDIVKTIYDFTNGHKYEKNYMQLDVVWLEEPAKKLMGSIDGFSTSEIENLVKMAETNEEKFKKVTSKYNGKTEQIRKIVYDIIESKKETAK